MNILVIITPFAPAQTPNTLRWQALINFFLLGGTKVYVLTSKRKGSSEHPKTTDVLPIYRAGYNTLMDLLYDKLNSQKRRNETGSNNQTQKPSILSRTLEKLVDKFWRNRYWPDGSKLFIQPATLLGLDIVAKKNISHIVSVGLPFSAHLIAQNICAKNSNIHWHMDIEDPFSYSKEFWVNNFSKFEEKNIQAEKNAFKLSKSINVTNPKAKEKYIDLFGSSAKNIVVIPPLFEHSQSFNSFELNLYNEKVHLGFFGSFYENVRSPLAFLKFLNFIYQKSPQTLNKTQFHFFGQQNKFSYPIFDAFPKIRSHIILHGFYDRPTSLKAMSQMDIMINFGNSTDYHLPSKVVDYLYVNKAILNITSIDNDASQVFFESYDDILNLNLTELDQEVALSLFEDFVLRERKNTKVNLEAIKKYLPEQIGELYIQAFNNSNCQ